MGDFFAWAATGLVTGLQVWSEGGQSRQGDFGFGFRERGADGGYRQRFFLRQREGHDIEIMLIDSGIAFHNGHAVTAVWAASKGASYGHCIYLENHTTGAMARLPENVALIRPKASFWKITSLGFIATFLATISFLIWLYLQRGSAFTHNRMFLFSTIISIALLFVIGAVVSKLIHDYIRANDDQKIWLAADNALINARRLLLQKPSKGKTG